MRHLFSLILGLLWVTAFAQEWEVGPVYLVRGIEGHPHPVFNQELYEGEEFVVHFERIEGVQTDTLWLGMFLTKPDSEEVLHEFMDRLSVADLAEVDAEGEFISFYSSLNVEVPPGTYDLKLGLMNPKSGEKWLDVRRINVLGQALPTPIFSMKPEGPGLYHQAEFSHKGAGIFGFNPITGDLILMKDKAVTLSGSDRVEIGFMDIEPQGTATQTDGREVWYLSHVIEIKEATTGEVAYTHYQSLGSVYPENKSVIATLEFGANSTPGTYLVTIRVFDELFLKWTECTATVHIPEPRKPNPKKGTN